MKIPHIGVKQSSEDIEQIVSLYESRLLRYVTRLTGNPSVAEDIVQNTFIKLAAYWKEELKDSGSLSVWLHRVAHNESVDWVKREVKRDDLHKRYHEQIGEHFFPSESQGGASVLGSTAVVLEEALNTLTDRERNIVILKIYEEMSYKEIAEIMGLTESNVGFILHGAIKKLSKYLMKKGVKNGR